MGSHEDPRDSSRDVSASELPAHPVPSCESEASSVSLPDEVTNESDVDLDFALCVVDDEPESLRGTGSQVGVGDMCVYHLQPTLT